MIYLHPRGKPLEIRVYSVCPWKSIRTNCLGLRGSLKGSRTGRWETSRFPAFGTNPRSRCRLDLWVGLQGNKAKRGKISGLFHLKRKIIHGIINWKFISGFLVKSFRQINNENLKGKFIKLRCFWINYYNCYCTFWIHNTAHKTA
jgi:hypothetical protein